MVCSTYQNIMPSLSVKLSLFQQSVGLEGAPQMDNYAALGSKRIRDVQNYICCLPALNCFCNEKAIYKQDVSRQLFLLAFSSIITVFADFVQTGNSQ